MRRISSRELLEPEPVVAELFRFAPVLVAGDAWPLLAAEMLIEAPPVAACRRAGR